MSAEQANRNLEPRFWLMVVGQWAVTGFICLALNQLFFSADASVARLFAVIMLSLGLLAGGVLTFDFDDLACGSKSSGPRFAERSLLLYTILIGWSVVIANQLHWSAGPVFVAVVIGAIARFGKRTKMASRSDSDQEIQVEAKPAIEKGKPRLILSDDENEESFTERDLEEENISPDLVRQVNFVQVEDRTYVTAIVRENFEQNADLRIIHLPLFPPFNSQPECDWIQLNGPEVDLRITECSRMGIRAEIRKSTGVSSKDPSASVLIEFTLSETQANCLAKAG